MLAGVTNFLFACLLLCVHDGNGSCLDELGLDWRFLRVGAALFRRGGGGEAFPLLFIRSFAEWLFAWVDGSRDGRYYCHDYVLLMF